MKRICLIIPYFGNFNNYFSYFLKSCEVNSSIDWIIYTDSIQCFEWPPNVHKVQCSFCEFREKIQKLFDFEICLDQPYKLCDYRPVYGEALAYELEGYDFWGYCDCDLIFGNIRQFLTEDLLDKYDKLFTRGHFSLYRNNEQVNAFYRKQKRINLKTVFTSSESFSFDEWGRRGGGGK